MFNWKILVLFLNNLNFLQFKLIIKYLYIMSINQISVFLPNKPGQLANFFEVLKENKIYVRSLTVAETEEYGLILILVDQFDDCVSLLEEKEYLFTITEVVAVNLSDNIAALYEIAKTLGSNDINIEYLQ